MTATYAWKLTYDHLDHVRDDTAGPYGINPALEARLDTAIKMGRERYYRENSGDDRSPLVAWFKIYDDDGVIYYTGVRTGVESDAFFRSEEGFEPLDDYGTPNAGATEIRYYNPKTDRWDTL